MKRLRYTTIILIIMFCIVPVTAVMMARHISISRTVRNMGSGTFGQSSVILKIDTEEVGPVIRALDKNANSAVYMDTSDLTGTIRYMAYRGTYNDFPMKCGRFFYSSDFQSDNPVCVIGKDRERESYSVNEERYISVDGQEFKVIGVIGYDIDTVIDSWVFVNLYSAQEVRTPVFTYDFMKEQDASAATERILACLEKQGIDADVYAGGSRFSDSIMPDLLSGRWFIALLFACFISLWMLSVRWMEQQKREVCIRRLVGASKTDILKSLLLRYASLFLLSLVVGFLYCRVVYPASLTSILKGYAVTAVFVAVFLIHAVHSLLNAPIEEAIR